MRGNPIIALLTPLALALAGTVPAALGQTYTFRPYVPVVAQESVVVPPAVVTAPATTVWRPVVGATETVELYSPAASTETVYLPAPEVVTTLRPAATVVPSTTVTVYQPAAATAPMVTYRPVETVAVPAAIPVGRPVVIRQKVYVPGQPVRNFFKAITP